MNRFSLQRAGLAAFLVLALVAVAPVAQAQLFYEPLRFGVKAGATYSTLSDEGDVAEENYTWGFVGGLVLSAKFNEAVGLQGELLYNRKGAEIDYDNSVTGNGATKLRLDYIQLPVLFTANAGPVQFQLGPYVAYLVNADITNENDNNVFNFVEDLDVDRFNRWDFGLAGGVAVDFNPIQVGLRAEWGLSNVAERNEFDDVELYNDNSNVSFNLYAAFLF